MYISASGGSILEVPFDPVTGQLDRRLARERWTVSGTTIGRGLAIDPAGNLVLFAEPVYSDAQMQTLIIRNWPRLLEKGR